MYQVAFSPRERPLIFELPGGRSYRATFTGIVLGSPVLACDGLLLAESNSTAGLCLDVDRAVELDRRSWSTGQAQALDSIVASLRLGPVPRADAPAACKPVFRLVSTKYLLVGGYSYRLDLDSGSPPATVSFHVPASRWYGSLEWPHHLRLRDVASGSWLVIDLLTREESERELLSVAKHYRDLDLDVGAVMDQIVASVQFGGPPVSPGCPAPVFPELGQTIGEGAYRYDRHPRGFFSPPGFTLAPSMNSPQPLVYYEGFFLPRHITFGVPPGMEAKLSWDHDAVHGIRLTDPNTGSWLCIDAELVAECGRSITPGAEHLGPLFDRIVESLRLGTAEYELRSRTAKPES